MSLAAIVAQSVGTVTGEIGNKKLDSTVKGTFTSDTIISSLLVAGPSCVLSVLFLFSRFVPV